MEDVTDACVLCLLYERGFREIAKAFEAQVAKQITQCPDTIKQLIQWYSAEKCTSEKPCLALPAFFLSGNEVCVKMEKVAEVPFREENQDELDTNAVDSDEYSLNQQDDDNDELLTDPCGEPATPNRPYVRRSTGKRGRFVREGDGDGVERVCGLKLPLHLGQLTVFKLGKVVPECVTRTAAYPIGYTSERSYHSILQPRHRGRYRAEILEGSSGRPLFRVTPLEDPSYVYTSETPTGALKRVVEKVTEMRTIAEGHRVNTTISGPLFFGLYSDIVCDAIHRLPGADKVNMYQPKAIAHPRRSVPSNRRVQTHKRASHEREEEDVETALPRRSQPRRTRTETFHADYVDMTDDDDSEEEPPPDNMDSDGNDYVMRKRGPRKRSRTDPHDENEPDNDGLKDDEEDDVEFDDGDGAGDAPSDPQSDPPSRASPSASSLPLSDSVACATSATNAAAAAAAVAAVKDETLTSRASSNINYAAASAAEKDDALMEDLASYRVSAPGTPISTPTRKYNTRTKKDTSDAEQSAGEEYTPGRIRDRSLKRKKSARGRSTPDRLPGRKSEVLKNISSFGRINPGHPGYHNPKHIFPVGFTSTRLLGSSKPGDKPILYTSSILEGPHGPLFRVTAEDDERHPCEAATATGAWKLMCDRRGVARRSGTQLFRLDDPEVKRQIEALPFARQCQLYQAWQ